MLPYESIDEANDSLEKLVHFAIGRSHGLVTEMSIFKAFGVTKPFELCDQL
ncbi:hypothetical protein Ccrd_007026 [Cynara cardunculus var. scolymus]|uniref:Uncharacterized protein n=1 Tax=Cynara cardunculus var. scolymus TaxID=59895 RepID=A0A103XHS6_CYNCS|nr:hypothetical protein Ccrd_007026 [Cynara cardunculus var. scolymus]